MTSRLPCLFFAIIPLLALAAAPSTQPATAPDQTMDWLLSQSTTAPAPPSTAPATAPSVFAPAGKDKSRQATLLLSDGQKIVARFTTTPEQPIRVYDNDKKEYRDLPFQIIKSMRARVLWERQQPEWKFKESGSDVMEYTGKTYPARETEYVVTLANGQIITGAVAVPLYQQLPQGTRLFVLHKRDKGDVGQSLKDLVFIQQIDFAD